MFGLEQKTKKILMTLILGLLLIFSPFVYAKGESVEITTETSESETFLEKEESNYKVFKKLKEVKIKGIMNPNPPTIPINTPVEEAAKKMKEQKIGCLPVVRKDKTLLGIITEDDFIDVLKPLPLPYYGFSWKKQAEKKTAKNVSDLMNSDPITLKPNDSVEELAKIMAESNTNHIPITKDEKFIGLVTIREMLSLF
ncbi:hypothetical protein AKJ49_00125 [candidate division MSBL1 archaeon SCGC-AAA382A03]|uniref:CBS domain-containing protein n=1 Tax=candidate division MSBL1 archaeon SCGC-AAA382A03 TaxID=1698278 RepID=A0A133VH31_9EURY|nr:hypothetical protein AKJ49_00125 [candidate division MSBL1 archaeon SCGC-AAA382A03]